MESKIRYIPYGRQHLDSSDLKAVDRVLKSDWITQGPTVREFENGLAGYCGVRYAVAVSSGTAALHLACLAAGVDKKSEVITSSMTFAATSNSILYCEGRPIFADIEEDTANIDPADIIKKISRRTRVLLPVHYAGFPCKLQEIKRIAKKYNLLVIEDACHAFGADYQKEKIGSCKYSDMAIFSFHPVKTITTGEGGAVLTNNKKFYDRLLLLRTHGITKDFSLLKRKNKIGWYYEMQELGFNYRISDIQCALGISQLRKIDSFIKKRRRIANFYNRKLSGLCQFILPEEKTGLGSSWHLYPLRFQLPELRDKVYSVLRRHGIGVQVHYIPVYLHPYYLRLGFKKGCCPNAERHYLSELSIPIYPQLKIQDAEFIVKKILSVVNKGKISSRGGDSAKVY